MKNRSLRLSSWLLNSYSKHCHFEEQHDCITLFNTNCTQNFKHQSIIQMTQSTCSYMKSHNMSYCLLEYWTHTEKFMAPTSTLPYFQAIKRYCPCIRLFKGKDCHVSKAWCATRCECCLTVCKIKGQQTRAEVLTWLWAWTRKCRGGWW